MGSLSQNEQRKLAYFHALGRAMTESTQEVYESKYKSSHNVRLNETWSDNIAFASTYLAAYAESLTNSAVTLFDMVTLNMIPGSNGQAYAFISGGTFDIYGNVTTGGTFIRPFISPVDIPNTQTNAPSNGYLFKLYNSSNTQITLTQGAWSVDYYSGIIHFAQGYTPADLGWGAIKGTFFQYTGKFGLSGATDNGYTSVLFNSGNNFLIFDSGKTTQTIINLSSLDIVNYLSTSNNNMSALTVTSDNSLACLTGLTSNPVLGSTITVFINGVQVALGDGIKTLDCYFSNDNGLTAKTINNVALYDQLYWNPSYAGYNLDNSVDKITFLYLTK